VTPTTTGGAQSWFASKPCSASTSCTSRTSSTRRLAFDQDRVVLAVAGFGKLQFQQPRQLRGLRRDGRSRQSTVFESYSTPYGLLYANFVFVGLLCVTTTYDLDYVVTSVDVTSCLSLFVVVSTVRYDGLDGLANGLPC